MQPAHNPQSARCDAGNQRVGGGGAPAGAGAGSGNGDAPAAGAAAAFGFFGFFGRITWRGGFGGGPAGCNSATTGLGSMLVDAGVEKSPGT
jgi:hypothetical protein